MSNKKVQVEENKELDFSKKFIVHGRFPIYHIDNLKPIIDNEKMTIKKIPMGVDGTIVWTYLHISLKPKQFTDPYSTDTEIRITALEGESWMHIMYKGDNAGNIIEPGDIIVIPKGASFVLSNQSKEETFVYAIDGNTLLQVD
jgi:mannose-6-phosphate isomerase-like protein (cupin superfamily)